VDNPAKTVDNLFHPVDNFGENAGKHTSTGEKQLRICG
jgi:hypothetical protein